MEVLVLGPLRNAAQRPSGSDLRVKPARTNEQDQQEILEVLLKASSDPSFPFRILITSRPERVSREFFDPERNTSLAQKLDLHKPYNADHDIFLFLQAQFNLIRRRYNLPPWPPSETIQILMEKASGQFIYAATIIRFLDAGHREPPEALLKAILKIGANVGTTQ